MSEAYDFGRKAEEFIVQKYLKNGYQILERNWIYRPAEVDIIAFRDNVLAIVEVKARKNSQDERIEDQINRKKKTLLIMAANEYIERHEMDVACRFDIAIVTAEKDGLRAKMFIDAFQSHEI